MSSNLLVSVCMITYGHEKYIREAIEGVLMQECDFEIELILSNDCSPDQTDDIIHDILANHPKASWIKYYNHDRNIGMMPNFVFALQQCQCEYIALCEGDDYWTDPLKLQKQVDILEANPNLVGCFHNSEERYWNDYSKASSLFVSFPSAREITIKDLTQYNMIPTASIVFKSPLPSELITKEFATLPMGDWPLHLLNTRKGNYFYLPQVMSVRNLNPNSVWGMREQKINVAHMICAYKMLIDSCWLKQEVVDLLNIGCKNLENNLLPRKDSEYLSLKKRMINKIISVLKKI
ncbi:glycosyltransferase [Flavobacterium sp. XN-5]|uniref:glycosyltransferase family 2 protein n=1 Tax=Flavobacterium sp. XN-5 TaxID=2599390 RepID=UPI0011C748DB|nr:glycosyltransferase [Flavobacterium sp. XN-5]NGY37445.1 glycosyltransferase [Flavobacterium sp. XN-5]